MPNLFPTSSSQELPLSLEESIQQLKEEIVLRKKYEMELDEALKLAEQATRHKSQFLANMSHEIRTPLGLILGFTEELINSCEMTPANLQLISTIRRNGEVLTRLIDDVLDLAKIEAGKVDYSFSAIRTHDFLGDLEINFTAKCSEKRLSFALEKTNDLPEIFTTDEVRLKQILINLVSNGIKHTDAGGLRLKVSYSPETHIFNFDVFDTGSGIPLENQQNIFETFQQLNKERPGTGLGLALSRNLARGLQGDLKLIHSLPQQGCWFRVKILNQKLTLKSLPQVRTQKDHSPKPLVIPDLTGINVLIVDDLEDNVRLLEAIIRPTKAQVSSLTCPQKVLSQIDERPFDLVLLDLQMPVRNGFEVLRLLKARNFTGQVWAVSASAMSRDIETCLEAGFDQHISKPIQRNDFYHKLMSLKIH